MWDDECFVWPLASAKRGTTSRGETGGAALAECYICDLMNARERQLAGRQVDLALDDQRVQDYIHDLVPSEALFNGKLPLLLLDVRRTSSALIRDSDNSILCGILCITCKETTFESLSRDQMEVRARELLRGESVSLTTCTVLDAAGSSPDASPTGDDFVAPSIDAGDIRTLLNSVFAFPEQAVQRFAVLGPVGACLSPARQNFFANFLSELAGLVEAVNIRRDFQAYSVAHALKSKQGPSPHPLWMSLLQMPILRSRPCILRRCAPTRRSANLATTNLRRKLR